MGETWTLQDSGRGEGAEGRVRKEGKRRWRECAGWLTRAQICGCGGVVYLY